MPSSEADSPDTDAQVTASDGKPASASVVDRIFGQLSEGEIEGAARASSYRYLVASAPAGESGRQQRDRHARATIGRYVAVEGKLDGRSTDDRREAAALAKLRATLEYRAEKRVDDIVVCFDEQRRSGDDKASAAIREGLERRFVNKTSVVRGYSKEGRALFQNFPWSDTAKDGVWGEEFYIKGNIYMLERALACTERNTDGERDRVIVLYDYNGSGMKNNPPPLLVKKLLSDLRDHWPERLQHVFLVDAPLAFRAFWAIIKHFVDPITKELVQFVTGEEQKKLLRELISDDQAAPFMFDGGKNGEEVDMKSFFYDTPFDCVYGEEKR